MGVQTILTGNRRYYFDADLILEIPCDHHKRLDFLDVSALFKEDESIPIGCTLATAAKINLYIKLDEIVIPVDLAKGKDSMLLYYDVMDEDTGEITRNFIKISEYDGRLIKSSDVKQVTINTSVIEENTEDDTNEDETIEDNSEEPLV